MHLTRRTLLTAAAGLPFAAHAAAPRIKLRLLETSDLHMFVADHDYYRDKPDATVGLCRVATVIEAARAGAANHLLFDNGDIIQGNPLGDYMATPGILKPGTIHPIFRAMNTLGYAAGTLGNHEFNYGLDFLARSLEGLNFPLALANVTKANGGEFLPPTQIITRRLTAEDGSQHEVKIGIIGFVTPGIMIWDRGHLQGRLNAFDIVETAAKIVPGIRPKVDLLIALSHSGISTAPHVTGYENASYHLAGVPGFDVIFTGHSHRVFPGPDYKDAGGIDSQAGTLAGIPATMPGFWGSHLGVIDLTLEHDGKRWRPTTHTAASTPIYRRDNGKIVPLVEPTRAISEEIRAEHEATRVWVAKPVGETTAPLSTRFAFIGDTSVMDLINAAQLWYARDLLANTPHATLPLLSAAAPFKSGYTPDNYVDIAAGPLAIRDLAEIYLFANTLAAVRVPGHTLKAWLEKSASIFNTIEPLSRAHQFLIDRHVPGYNFDLIAGLSWEIDVTATPNSRIKNLSFAGKPLDPAQEFVVVTNNYRADGGGSIPGLDGKTTILRAPDLNRDALIRYVEQVHTVSPVPLSPWRFAPIGHQVTVVLETAPDAERVPAGLLPGRRTGVNQAGFSRFQLQMT